MNIEKLAEITAEEFSTVHTSIADLKSDVVGIKDEMTGMKGEMTDMKSEMTGMKGSISRLETGMKAVLEAVLEIPSKKVFEKLVHKVQDIDERVTVVERKLHSTR